MTPPDPRAPLGAAELDRIEARASRVSSWTSDGRHHDAREALLLVAEVRGLRAEAERLTALVARLRVWCRQPAFDAMAALAHAHGFRASDAMVAEGRALWAEVDELLGGGGPGADRGAVEEG